MFSAKDVLHIAFDKIIKATIISKKMFDKYVAYY